MILATPAYSNTRRKCNFLPQHHHSSKSFPMAASNLPIDRGRDNV